jgi:LmbE family N-acetylglucosaminyl deacetylase
MSADRITMTMDEELGAAVRAAARRSGMSVSAWLTEAAAARLRNELLGGFLDQWQEEHGAFTEEELARAAETLGLGRRSRGSAV